MEGGWCLRSSPTPTFCKLVNRKKFKNCSTKLAQFFDTIFKSKFVMGGLALKTSFGDISGRDAVQNLKMTELFSTKLAQFFDTILKSKFAMGGGGWHLRSPPALRGMMNSTKFKNCRAIQHNFSGPFSSQNSQWWLGRCTSLIAICTRVVLQKLPQLSDTHFSPVLNKLEKKFFSGFIKYHLALHFIKIIQVSPSPNNNSMNFKVKSSITMDVATHL